MQRGLRWKGIFALLTLSCLWVDIALPACSQLGTQRVSLSRPCLLTPHTESFTQQSLAQLQPYSQGKQTGWGGQVPRNSAIQGRGHRSPSPCRNWISRVKSSGKQPTSILLLPQVVSWISAHIRELDTEKLLTKQMIRVCKENHKGLELRGFLKTPRWIRAAQTHLLNAFFYTSSVWAVPLRIGSQKLWIYWEEDKYKKSLISKS